MTSPFRKITLCLALGFSLASGVFAADVTEAAPLAPQTQVRALADSLLVLDKTRWVRERCNCRPRRFLRPHRRHLRRHIRRSAYYYGPTIIEYERAPAVYYRPAYVGGWGYDGYQGGRGWGYNRGGWRGHGFHGGHRGWGGGHRFGGHHRGWGGGHGFGGHHRGFGGGHRR